MAASYPSSVKTFTKKRDLLDIVLAADINLVYDEVTAIETTLGVSANVNAGWTSGAFTSATLNWPSVRARIQNIEYGLHDAYNDRVKSSGGSTITTTDNSTINLVLAAKTGQTGNLFQAKNAGGTIVTRILADGNLQVNGSNVSTVSAVESFTNKTLNGNNNTFINIPTSSMIVTGSTDIQEYVEGRPTVFYQSTAPTGVIPGTVWIDSSQNISAFDASALLLASDPSVSPDETGFRRVSASLLAPTSGDGANGDIWLQYI